MLTLCHFKGVLQMQTADDRLTFAVRFAQMDLDHLRAGDWLNLRDDADTFLGLKAVQESFRVARVERKKRLKAGDHEPQDGGLASSENAPGAEAFRPVQQFFSSLSAQVTRLGGILCNQVQQSLYDCPESEFRELQQDVREILDSVVAGREFAEARREEWHERGK